jgi:NADPH:quinone reductase-like Zn-dependent oxidoreductase
MLAGAFFAATLATPIDYQREDFTGVLSGGFDVVFDGIAEDGYRRSFATLKRGGLLCAYGSPPVCRRRVACLPC